MLSPFAEIACFACLLGGGLLSMRFNFLISTRYPGTYKEMSGYPSYDNEPEEVVRRARIGWRYWWNREYLALDDPDVNRVGAWMRGSFYATLFLMVPATIAVLTKSGNAV